MCAALGSQLKAHSHQQMKSCRAMYTDSMAFTQLVNIDAFRVHGQTVKDNELQAMQVHTPIDLEMRPLPSAQSEHLRHAQS